MRFPGGARDGPRAIRDVRQGYSGRAMAERTSEASGEPSDIEHRRRGTRLARDAYEVCISLVGSAVEGEVCGDQMVGRERREQRELTAQHSRSDNAREALRVCARHLSCPCDAKHT